MKRTLMTGSHPISRKPLRPRSHVSLARALSKLGVTSRSLAREMIEDGRVTVNGKILRNPELRVHPEKETIAVDGKAVARNRRIYLMMHKPSGYVTTRSDERGRQTVYDLLEKGVGWLFPVGRLDRDSEGLLLFTNDTPWANALTAPDSNVSKTYEVRLDHRMDDRAMERFRSGLILDDGVRTRPAEIRRGPHSDGEWVEVKLTEGRNRQIRRMMAVLGYKVTALIRTRIGPLSLEGLHAGGTRALMPEEVRALTVKTLRKPPPRS